MARQSGSGTALGGFRNEALIVDAFNKGGTFATKCLSFLGFAGFTSVKAIHIPSRLGADSVKKVLCLPSPPSASDLEMITRHQKADVRLQIEHNSCSCVVHLSLKKANANADFNQVDKRSVDTYKTFWGFDDDVCLWLKIFTGAASALEFQQHTSGLTVDTQRQRVQFRHMPVGKRTQILTFLESNKKQIMQDVIQGRGPLAADYIVVTRHEAKAILVHLCPIAKVLAFLLSVPISETSRGNIQFGKLTIQRYGGSPHPELLQFKIKPGDLFQVAGETIKVTISQSKS